MRRPGFLDNLKKREGMLRRLKKRELAIFNVMGRYGAYQIKIGPEDSSHHRPIEINGHIHHLFVKGHGVGPMPTKEDIDHNLKGTVIMNDVTVHIFDRNGDGRKVAIGRAGDDGAHAKRSINLAGSEGERMLNEMESSGELANKAYLIVQDDILKSI